MEDNNYFQDHGKNVKGLVLKMEKKIKLNLKKLFAIFTVIILLQNYGLILGNIAIAADNELFDFTTSGNSDFIQMMKDKENNSQESEEVQEENKEELETPENTTSEENSSEELPPEEEKIEEQPKEETPANTTSGDVQDTTGEPVEEEQPEEEFQEEPEKEEQIPDQVIFSKIASENSSIYKGYFYANIVSSQKYETNYNYTESIEIQDSNFVDEIFIEEEGDKFVFDTGVELKIGSNTYYKQTMISEEEFKNILGQEGLIEFYTKDGELVGTINSQTESIDGIYVFNYDVDISEIIIKIINPIQNGTLNIKHAKAIKSELEYSRKQIELFRNIKTAVKVNAVYKQENVWELETITNLINLEETESRMDLDLNTNEFSTMLENQITFNVTLKTNEERYDLFQDPTIEILMPSAIENVEITSVNLLYKNSLTLSSWEVVENDAGKKVIKVALKGTQTEYTPGSMQEGTTLVIYTKINVDKLTSNTDEKIKMTYTNKNSSKLYYEVNGKEAEEFDIKFVSKEGILKSNSLLNYNKSLEGMYSFNDEVLIGSLDVLGSKKTASVNMAVVNNYSKELNNVSIIGRIPSQGVVDGNGNNLGITIDTILLNAVTYSGVSAKIYYSHKIDAPVEDESWSENIADYGLVKSYKIVLENPMKQGDRAEFGYNILIPENLNYNETLFSTYQVNYYIDNQLITEISSIGAETEKREIVLEDCSEQTEYENLTIGTKVTKGGVEVQEGEEIFERQILRYTVVLKNTTLKTLNNVKIKGKAANSNLYYLKTFKSNEGDTIPEYKVKVEDHGEKEFEEISIARLEPNEELKLEYEAIVEEIKESEDEYVWGEIFIYSDELQETKIETSRNRIKQGKIELNLQAGVNEYDIVSDSLLNLKMKIKNISNEDLENIELSLQIPKDINFDPELGYFDENRFNLNVVELADKKQIIFEIPKLYKGEEKNIYIEAIMGDIDLFLKNKEIVMISKVDIGSEKYISNDYVKNVFQRKTDVELKFSSNLANGTEVKHEDKIEYILKLKNIGIMSTGLNIKDNFPTGLDIYSIELIKEDNISKLDTNVNYLSLDEELDVGKELILIIKARVNENDYEYNQEYIENNLVITGKKIDSRETNVISFKITNPNKEENKEEPEISIEDFYTKEELEKIEEIKKEEEEAEKNNENNVTEEDKKEETDKKDEENIKQDSNKEENKTEENNSDNKVENNNKNEETKQEENVQKPSTNNNNSNNNDYNINQNQTVQNTPKGKYSIKGKAWVDLNKNGKCETEEKLLPNTNIRLYKSSNGTSVVYSQNNLVSKIKTDSDGIYEFNNLEEGYYLVMAEYDSENYRVTEYKSEYAGESSNSDFISKTTTIDGNKKTVAISDILQISSSNLGSIDLGLIQKDEVDIEIKKSISSITVEDDEKKETINYNEDKIAKLEIAAKKIDKTKITIMYEFEIKNNGDLDTYVTNIADYLPKGLEFNEKNNSGWYKKDDNTISNLSLVNTKIEPGKTKRLKLALSTNVTDDKLGSYINKVEVLETTNDKKVKETNLDNNKSEVELLITIKTGKVIIYLSIILLATGIVAGVIYLIKKKKINLKPVYK